MAEGGIWGNFKGMKAREEIGRESDKVRKIGKKQERQPNGGEMKKTGSGKGRGLLWFCVL